MSGLDRERLTLAENDLDLGLAPVILVYQTGDPEAEAVVATVNNSGPALHCCGTGSPKLSSPSVCLSLG